MFSRLLIATDLSSEAFATINCLAGLQVYGAKQCLLLECLTLHEINSIALDQTREAVEKNLQTQRDILEKQGFIVETRCVDGLPNQVINQIAEEENYSVIVVGALSHSLTSEAFLGGLAYDIIHFARKPILLIRLQESFAEGVSCIQTPGCNFGSHILFPTDFSANADHAFSYVKELVTAGVMHVTLMHVQDRSKIDPHLLTQLEEFNQTDETRLLKLKADLQQLGDAEIEIRILYGSPYVEIINFVHDQVISLVVMGSQGRGFVQELFLGSVSHNVARHVATSIMLIPAQR